MSKQGARAAATRPHVIRMVLVEEHPLVRVVLREIVGGQRDIDIVAEAADVDHAIAIIRDEMPDVVLVDTELPISLVVPAVQRLKRECPGSPVILLGHHGDDDELFAAIQAGAAAHVLEAFRDASLLGEVASEYVTESAFAPLSARETQILEAIAQGLTNNEVGAALGITEQTVKNHVSSILRKLAVNDRTQAVLYALRKSWITISDEPPPRRN